MCEPLVNFVPDPQAQTIAGEILIRLPRAPLSVRKASLANDLGIPWSVLEIELGLLRDRGYQLYQPGQNRIGLRPRSWRELQPEAGEYYRRAYR